MLDKPEFELSYRESGSEYALGSQDYSAVGISIKDRGTNSVYRMTLPIEPTLPLSADHASLVRAAMKSLRYLCSNLPDDVA
jgi:hypothetical protein